MLILSIFRETDPANKNQSTQSLFKCPNQRSHSLEDIQHLSPMPSMPCTLHLECNAGCLLWAGGRPAACTVAARSGLGPREYRPTKRQMKQSSPTYKGILSMAQIGTAVSLLGWIDQTKSNFWVATKALFLRSAKCRNLGKEVVRASILRVDSTHRFLVSEVPARLRPGQKG